MSVTDRITLIRTKVDILRLMADVYTWQCHTPEDVKKDLTALLAEIDALLKGSG